jgi:hypothetical protein
MKKAKIMQRNFVAKHAKTTGAGVHKAKDGKFASRARTKQNFIRTQGRGE